MHDDTFKSEDRDKFILLAERYNQTIKFYNVDECKIPEVEAILSYTTVGVKRGRWTKGVFYDLLVPFMIPKDGEKVLYYDCDGQ